MNSELTEKTDIREGRSAAPISKSAADSEYYNTNRGALPEVASFRGWILYDGACSSCTASAGRFDRIFRRRGFLFLPLQTEWVMKRLGLEAEAPLKEMHVLTDAGQDIAGADAVIFLARQIWWAWPFAALARLPGMHALLDRGYRWIAAHRGCGHVSCNPNTRGRRSHRLKKTAGPHRTGHWRQPLLEILPAWIALMGLPISVLPLRDHLAPWQFMWLMAAAIFFGCKWLTAWRALRRNSDAGITRTLGYFFAWPGMDAEKFLSRPSQNLTALSRQVYETPSLAGSDEESIACELSSVEELSGNMPDRASRMAALPFFSAIAKAFLGVVLLFGVARFAQQPLLTGWMGMIGLILILHFGLFQLLAAGWRKAGIDVEPIMREPLRSKSISEFWGHRWNSAFNRLALKLVFRPTIRRLRGRSCCDAAEGSRGRSTWHLNRGIIIATLAAFLVSGLIHELMISLPARAGYGLPTAYFLLQGIGILAERAFPQIRGHTFTALITAVPAFWLFHPPFVHDVILPFMKAIGAL